MSAEAQRTQTEAHKPPGNHWVLEQIEAARLCLEDQVAIDFPPVATVCSDTVWQQQVWD